MVMGALKDAQFISAERWLSFEEATRKLAVMSKVFNNGALKTGLRQSLSDTCG